MINRYWLHEDRLQGEYKDSFQQIETYVLTNNIDAHSSNELLSHLLDTFLSAQENGQPVEEITGNDLPQFCENICSAYGRPERMIYYLEQIMSAVSWFFGVSALELVSFLLDYAGGKQQNLFTYYSETNILQFGLWLILIVLIVFLLNHFEKRSLFRKQSILPQIINGIRILLILIMVVVWIYGIRHDIHIIRDIPVWISFSISGPLVLFYRILTRQQRKEKKENRISFLEYAGISGEDLDASTRRYAKTLYFKKNKKRAKKGLPPLSQTEFLNSLAADDHWYNRSYYYIAYPLVITGFSTYFLYTKCAFESTLDLWLFPCILLPLEYLFAWAFWRLKKKGRDKKLDWIRHEMEEPAVWEEPKE